MAWYTSHKASSTTSPVAGQQRLVEPTSVGQPALTQANASPNTKGDSHRAEDQDRVYQTRSMPSAPIAQVLNNEANMLCTSQSVPTAFTSATAPFSGRLIDLLLDSDEHSRQRRDHDQPSLQPDLGCSPSVIKLPRLPQPPKRTAKRPRIPPLLQGLHQPPPLPPEGRLFPPITGENSAFPRSAGQRSYDPFFEEATNKQAEEHAFLDGNGGDSSIRTVQDSENPFDAKVASWSASSGTAVSHETSMAASKIAGSQKQRQGKSRRQRNRWSEQETKDLLLGVNKYGIGNWKKILQDPAFVFNNRSAVDLKDRFRVCCPGEGLKLRQPKPKENMTDTTSGPSLETAGGLDPGQSNTSSHEQLDCDTTATTKSTALQSKSARTPIPDLAEMGIHKPFPQNTRRPRRAFTASDDVNLLKGFERYGLVWHSMRDDTELGFSGRHPTDLRDRFRIKYPKKYVKAGNKLKAKEDTAIIIDQPQTHTRDNQQRAPQNSIQHPQRQLSHTYYYPQDSIDTPSSSFISTSIQDSTLKPFAAPFSSSSYLTHPLLPITDLSNTNTTNDDDTSPSFLENVDSDESPITLNRDILRWANTNPSSLFAMAPVSQGQGQGQGRASVGDVNANGNGNGSGNGLPEADVWLADKDKDKDKDKVGERVKLGFGGGEYNRYGKR